MIRAQQEAVRELSTPVLQLRERLLILPIIGVVDPLRARQLTDLGHAGWLAGIEDLVVPGAGPCIGAGSIVGALAGMGARGALGSAADALTGWAS